MGRAAGAGSLVIPSLRAFGSRGVEVAVHEGCLFTRHNLCQASCEELRALSVSDTCLRWNSDGSGVTLWPNVAFLPKVLPGNHLNQPIQLARFDPPSGEDGSELLCPLRALRAYISATTGIRQSEQLFVCHGGPNRGCALTKQRLSHWIVETITHAYGASGRPPPSRVRCHSTRSVSTSWAALRGVPLRTISPHPMGMVLMPSSAVSRQ